MPITRDRRVTCEEQPKPPTKIPLPKLGKVIRLKKAIETFGGYINGEVEISQAYYDFYGTAFVNLARDGRTVVTGIQWPLLGNRHAN